MEELEYQFDDFISEIITTHINEIREKLGDFEGYFGQYFVKSSSTEVVIEEFGSTLHFDVNQQQFTCSGLTPEVALDKIYYIKQKYLNQ